MEANAWHDIAETVFPGVWNIFHGIMMLHFPGNMEYIPWDYDTAFSREYGTYCVGLWHCIFPGVSNIFRGIMTLHFPRSMEHIPWDYDTAFSREYETYCMGLWRCIFPGVWNIFRGIMTLHFPGSMKHIAWDNDTAVSQEYGTYCVGLWRCIFPGVWNIFHGIMMLHCCVWVTLVIYACHVMCTVFWRTLYCLPWHTCRHSDMLMCFTGRVFYVMYASLPMTTPRCQHTEPYLQHVVTTSTACLPVNWQNHGKTLSHSVRLTAPHLISLWTLCTRQKYELLRIMSR